MSDFCTCHFDSFFIIVWKKVPSQNNVSDPFRLTMKGYCITSTDLKPVVFGTHTPPPSLLVFVISHLSPLWGLLLVYGNGRSAPGQSVPTRCVYLLHFFYFYESLGSGLGSGPNNGKPEELVLWLCPPIGLRVDREAARKTHRESSRKFLRATRRKQSLVEARTIQACVKSL